MNIESIPNVNYLWAYLVIEELYRTGVMSVFIAPGSRSTPLTLTAAEHTGLKKTVHFDERGLAFNALGLISATGNPAVLISTSGTAAANFFPAVIEASKKKLPLIIFTADRPPELRKTGAHQTIDQPEIFGKYIRWSIDMPAPDSRIDPKYILSTIDQAVSRTRGELPGPVHINYMFREPLAPEKEKFDCNFDLIKKWSGKKEPFTTYINPEKSIPVHTIKETAEILNRSEKGVIIAGKIADRKSALSLIELSNKLGWPLFGDIVSGTRNLTGKYNVNNWDLMLLDKGNFKDKIDTVLHVGGRITSRRWHEFIGSHRPENYITVIDHPLRNDPLNIVTTRIIGSPGEFIKKMLDYISPHPTSSWLKRILELSNNTEKIVSETLAASKILSEAHISRILSEKVIKNSAIFLGNSMPVRDMDMFSSDRKVDLVWGGNRGASGIDGIIASASGFFRGSGLPTTLLIGDISALHDLNSLKFAADAGPGFNIILINNDGGGIFSFLPVAGFKENFEEYFATPQGIKFEHAAKMFGINYIKVESVIEFNDALDNIYSNGQINLVEIFIDRTDNVKFHKDLFEKLKLLYKKEI